MSAAVPSTSAGLPVVNQALEPAWVRHGSSSTQKAYAAALSFEATLVEELSRTLTATGGLGGEGPSGEGEAGEGEGAAPGGQLSSMLPQALSSGVIKAGGLGLAAQLTRDLEGPHTGAATGASGGTPALPGKGQGA